MSTKQIALHSVRGENVLKEAKEKSLVARFFEQMNDPLIFILFIAAAISMLLREFGDTSIILAVILLNAILGLIQEGKAKKALDSLKEMTSPHAVILQDGEPVDIPAKDLICGDYVLLDAGRQVPADLLLTEVQSLKIEESALTGESLPVEKDLKHHNEAFMSTNVTYGRGVGKVCAIGMNTEIGKIATLINEASIETTPLQKRLADLGKILSIISLVLCGLLFLIAILQKRDIPEMLITAISLAVAAVPEGLPAIVTMVLALSVSRMVKVNTIIKRLPSVETLGCVSVICSDKTGTLTQNKMSVEACYVDGEILTPQSLTYTYHHNYIDGFTLCNDAVLSNDDTNSELIAMQTNRMHHSLIRMGDPTELALLDMAAIANQYRAVLELRFPRISEIAFDSSRKMMSTLHRMNQNTIQYTKGSPDEVLKRCRYILMNGECVPLTGRYKKEITQAIKHMAANALRILALATKNGCLQPEEKDLVFVGLVGMKDPLRPEARLAVSECKDAGVRTIMITGDRPDTAAAIAGELGLIHSSSQVMSATTLDTLTENELNDAVKSTTVFAQVTPKHKTMIVNALKANGEIVAMTGDGVNDAPSLQSADVGIAMGIAGTDVAKNAADIILTDDNFSTIVKAIEQGRCIYANIKKSVLFLLSSNFGEIITMLAAIIGGFSSPLKSSHILWINLITDSLPALALGIDLTGTASYMKKPPRPKEESLFAEGGLLITLLYGLLISLISISAFLYLPFQLLLHNELPITLANLRDVLIIPEILTHSQTYAFTVLGLSQLFHAIGMRDVTTSIFKTNPFQNRLMIAAVIVGFGLQFLVTSFPYFASLFGTSLLHINDWLLLLFLSAMPLVAHEILLPLCRKVSRV